MHCMMCDIIVFKDFLFMRPHKNDMPAFSKNCAPGTVFENLRFGSRKFRLRVDERLKRRKKSPFSRKYQDRCGRYLNSLRSKRFRVVSRVKDRATKTARKMAPPPPPSFVLWLSFHFSRDQNRESRSSVFLCSETARKRLLRRLGP